MNKDFPQIFITRLTEVNGEYVTVGSRDRLPAMILQFLSENRLRTLAISKGVFSIQEKQVISEQAEIIIDFDGEKHSHEEGVILVNRAEVGISRADGLIPETGSVVMLSKHRGDRLCSTLPEVHIVIGWGCSLYATAAEFYADVKADLTYTLITGPSRTADIEKKLVLGAHGPRRLIVFGP